MLTAEKLISFELPETTQGLTLTTDQRNALQSFYEFMLDPSRQVWVLSGYSGCGKSTLVRTIIDMLPRFMKTIALIQVDLPHYELEVTATTNKAAENLARILNMDVSTIHSFLGLRVVPVNVATGETRLELKNHEMVTNTLLFCDEASFIDWTLLSVILSKLDPRNTKIVFVGDPAQLVQPKSSGTPVFSSGYSGAALTQVVRQANAETNPIVDLSTQFRHTVNTGVWPQFKPDGHHIKWLGNEEFKAAILEEFGRPDWRYHDSKVLGFTNDFVIAANHYIRNHVEGSPNLEVGDYAVCNSFVQVGRASIKTDQLVEITGIENEERLGVMGKVYEIDGKFKAFMPISVEAKNARIKLARSRNELGVLHQIDQSWIDLRAAYAQTINKSQGSTYDKVFIDLDNVSRCHVGDQIARMMYVGVSRARSQVIFTGDLV